MLVLTRKSGESIVLGHNITVKVSQISGNRVKLCIDAPRECLIQRSEIQGVVTPKREASSASPALHRCGVPR